MHTIDKKNTQTNITLSVLMRSMDSDYLFSIFKLFLMSSYFCLVLSIW